MTPYRVNQKSYPTQSVIEKYVSGRLKCSKRCSVAKRLSYIMSIFCYFFGTVNPQICDFEAKGILEILKKSSKAGDRFAAVSDLQNNDERVVLEIGNRELN